MLCARVSVEAMPERCGHTFGVCVHAFVKPIAASPFICDIAGMNVISGPKQSTAGPNEYSMAATTRLRRRRFSERILCNIGADIGAFN